MNHPIIYQMQDIFNLLPDVTHPEFVKSMYVKTNDQMLVVYVSALCRCTIALNNLINNKLAYRDAEKKEMNNNKKEDKVEKKEGTQTKEDTKEKMETDEKSSK